MIFLILWVICGLIGEGLFMYGMKRNFPDDFKLFERELFPFELMLAIISGPCTFLVLAVVFSKLNDEEE